MPESLFLNEPLPIVYLTINVSKYGWYFTKYYGRFAFPVFNSFTRICVPVSGFIKFCEVHRNLWTILELKLDKNCFCNFCGFYILSEFYGIKMCIWTQNSHKFPSLVNYTMLGLMEHCWQWFFLNIYNLVTVLWYACRLSIYLFFHFR